MWKRQPKASVDRTLISDDFLEWVANMPYVVERTRSSSSTVRVYDIDCEPLGHRSPWVILECSPDSPLPTGISVLLPQSLAEKAATAGWGHSYTHKVPKRDSVDRPARVVFRIDALADRRYIETVVMGSYRALIAWT
ncbi:MAG TPA: hypothetical protein VGN51_22970 [Acidimicrobiia bacterium]|jgi:hypothetical protein